MFCASATWAQAAATTTWPLPKHAPYPGGVAVVKLGEAMSPVREVLFNGKRVLTLQNDGEFLAVVGIPLDTPAGSHQLQVKAGQGSAQLAFTTEFEVKARSYPAQHLQINPRFLKPNAEDQKRIEREVPLIIAAREHWIDEAPATMLLDLPASGRLSSNFGLRRVLNGQEGPPHAGLDVSIGTGTPLRAAAAGRVAGAGNFFYAGNSVFVDHGRGFITLYIHMSRIDVKEGDAVERGSVLGLSGATGQVTGPHLHWGVLLNGTYVDPSLFLKTAR